MRLVAVAVPAVTTRAGYAAAVLRRAGGRVFVQRHCRGFRELNLRDQIGGVSVDAVLDPCRLLPATTKHLCSTITSVIYPLAV